MSFSSTELLQFTELKDLVARYAGSNAGRALVEELAPHTDRAALEVGLAESAEAIGYLRALQGSEDAKAGSLLRLRFDQLRDVESPVRILQVEGASLNGREILDLFHNFSLAGEFRGALINVVASFPKLARTSSPTCAIWRSATPALFFPMAALPIKPAWLSAVSGAILRNSRKVFRNRSNASCVLTAATVPCRKTLSPSAKTVLWCRL